MHAIERTFREGANIPDLAVQKNNNSQANGDDEDGHGAERRRRKSTHIDDKGEIRSTLTTCPADAHLAPHWIHSAILEAPDPAILHNSTLNLAPSVTPILASPWSKTAETEAMLERFTCLAT